MKFVGGALTLLGTLGLASGITGWLAAETYTPANLSPDDQRRRQNVLALSAENALVGIGMIAGGYIYGG